MPVQGNKQRLKEVSNVGLDLVILGVDPDNAFNVPQYYSLCNIKSVEPQFNNQTALNGYHWPQMLLVTIHFTDGQGNVAKLDFDIQDVTNQAGWTPDKAGLEQAAVDINSWKNACSASVAIGDVIVNTEDIELLLESLNNNTDLTAHTSLDPATTDTGAGNVAAGTYSVRITNIGAANADVNGGILEPGSTRTYTAAFRKTLPAIPYNATGTTIEIEFLQY